MKTHQLIITDTQSKTIQFTPGFEADQCQLVLAFSENSHLKKHRPYQSLREKFPKADIIICSTAGQFAQTQIENHKVVATGIAFEKSSIKCVEIDAKTQNSFESGQLLFSSFKSEGLIALLVLSEGSFVNGTELIEGLLSASKNEIPVFGGLAGDEANFQSTIVGLNQDALAGKIVGVGFYGNRLQIGHGCVAGWQDFGPERVVTKSDRNILYSIGDEPALTLYKKYLGQYAADLPGSALHFPLSMRDDKRESGIIRTILSINEDDLSMTFAGNIPEGTYVRLMKSSADNLIDAAHLAAKEALCSTEQHPSFALLISCVGRRIVLGTRSEEELEVAQEVLGENTVLAGFYSYGEISPKLGAVSCDLHNQTMTIATFSEIE